MKRYHITILDWYRTSSYNDPTRDVVIECDGMDTRSTGDYMFWNYDKDDKDEVIKRIVVIAHYPIKRTVISKIEKL